MVQAMVKVLRREKDRGGRKVPVLPIVLVLVVLAIGGLWLAWMSGGPVPMRTIAQDVTGQVKP